jgi:TIGR03009 family protein
VRILGLDVARKKEMYIMRTAGIGLAAVLVATLAVQAQPPGGTVPGLPPPPGADPTLDAHLAQWANLMGKANTFSAKFDLTRTAAVFKKDHQYKGSVLCMKPNLARMSIGSTADKEDYEAYICNGKSLFQYEWKAKTIMEIPLTPGAGDSPMLDFLGGMTAAAAKKRFLITQFNPNDKTYVYFDIKPTLPKDNQEFEHIRLCLYGPNVPPPYTPYLPAQMYMLKPNGDAEMWKFSNQTLNVQGISEKVFQYEQPKDKGWTFKKASAPPPLPGGTNLPAGPNAVKR